MNKTEKKLFRQYMSIVVSIVLTVCIVLSFVASFMIKGSGRMRLEKTVDKVISTFVEAQDDEKAARNLTDNLVQILSEVGRTEIIIFDANGRVRIASEGHRDFVSRDNVRLSMDKIIAGETVFFETKSDFLYENIAIGKPIVYNKIIIGGVLCVISGEFISDIMVEILNYAALFGLVLFVVCIFIARALAKRQSRPVNMLKEAISIVSAGNFEKFAPLEIKGDLEDVSADFNKMAETIMRQEKTNKEFIGNISHEIRTPLTIITGFLQGIADGTVPEEKKNEYMGIVIDETKRLTRLVNELLEIARLESSANPVKLQNFDVGDLAKQVIIKFEKNIENKGLDVNFSFEENSCMVSADKDGIERVLTNLTDNAVKFADVGGYIKISTVTSGGKIQVAIENSGEGISREELNSIWNRFHKTDKSRSADKLGVGLGLYIVKNIINQHGEHITAESVPGQYTKFVFTLSRERSLKNGNKD
ncbi:MAG: HAMP domain-containing histidine kinase [Clostridia bacterium]|nr:HAMP domain-containing histidine kinase [Clostridia bacterium]